MNEAASRAAAVVGGEFDDGGGRAVGQASLGLTRFLPKLFHSMTSVVQAFNRFSFEHCR